MKNVLHSTSLKCILQLLFLCVIFLSHRSFSQSAPLPTDRARITVASIPDYYGGPNLKVLRTDAGTPLRAGTAWIWEKGNQEEPASYYASMRQKGLNAVRMILFDTWEVEAYQPSAQFTPTGWNDPVYRARQLARMERSVNYASANGLYIIINSHNKIPEYNETYANALWTYVAPYFANRTHVIYEASNEPMPGIGNNGDMGVAGATSSPRLQALKRTYNIIRNGAPDTHVMILTPPGINDFAVGTGMGNVAAGFAQLPGTVDWTKTSVAYHLYNNDRGFGNAAVNAANLRNLHSRYPGWPSENNFPASVSSATLGIDPSDNWRSAQFDNDIYVNQTCEKLGLGWSMWQINGQTQLDRNWPILWADAVAKGWNWIPDPTTPDTEAPTVPTALVATNITANSLTLSWTASTDNIAVTNYEIFRDGTSIGTTATAATTFNIAGLVCATNATFTVKAKDAAGNTSAAGNALSVTTGNCPTSFVAEAETNYTIVSEVGSNCTIGPSNYGATSTSNGLAVGLCDIGDEIKIAVNVFVSGNYDIQVRVRSGWTGSPMHFINNNKYEFRVDDVLRTFTYVPGSVSSTIDVDSYYSTVKLSGMPLTTGVHYIRVKALENWAKVDYVRLDLITDTQAPTIPNNLSASAITGSGFMLAWTASTDNVGVTGYEVFRNGISLGTTATTSFSITGLSCGTNSAMTVRTRDAVGNWSATGNILYVSTTPLPYAGTISGTTTICAGATTPLISNGLAGGTWSSSNTAVATVNASGVVSGVAAGTATITYSVAANGCSANTTSTIMVNALPNAGTISGTSTLTTGTTATLTSNGLSGGTWSSNNASVATVNGSGVVSGVSAGTATITYTVTSNGCTRSVSKSLTVTAPIITTTIVVRARSMGNAGANFRVEIMNSSAATGGTILQNSNIFTNLSTNFANYTFTATGTVNPNQIRVRYLNDMAPYDFEADYIQVNGTTYQTEAASTYSVGFWNSDNGCNNAGYLANSLIHCDGYFHFLATPTTTPIVIRTRSVNNAGASFRVEIMSSSAATGGTVLQSSNDFTNLSTNFTNYTFNATGNVNPNRIRVRYLNDMSPYDFEADYIKVNGTTYQTEAASTYSVGFWNAANGCNNGGFLANSLIHCSGYFHFLANSGARLSAESVETEPITSFGVYPNPAKYLINIILYTSAQQQVEMQITDLNGTVLSSFSEQVKAGQNTVTIPINRFNEGTFVISAEYDNRRSTAKFSVIR